MLRREACIGQLLNTSILTGCVTWFSMLLTPDSPTKLLRKPGSRPWLALPLKSEASGWASASVGLARGGWSLGAGATAAPARLCYRGCPCPQSLPSARRKPRWQVVWGDVQVAVTGTSIEPEARETGRLEPSSVAFLLGPALLLSTV